MLMCFCGLRCYKKKQVNSHAQVILPVFALPKQQVNSHASRNLPVLLVLPVFRGWSGAASSSVAVATLANEFTGEKRILSQRNQHLPSTVTSYYRCPLLLSPPMGKLVGVNYIRQSF